MNRTIKTILAAILAVVAVIAVSVIMTVSSTPNNAKAADILRDPSGVLVSALAIEGGTASGSNKTVYCGGGKELAIGCKFTWSNVMNSASADSSNVTFFIQKSIDGVNWNTNTALAAEANDIWVVCTKGGVKGPVNCTTNITINGLPYVRLKWISNACTGFYLTNVSVTYNVK